MRKHFSYRPTCNETADTLVESFGKLVDMSLDQKNSTDEYKQANRNFSEVLAQHCLTNTGLEFSTLDMIKNPNVYNNVIFKANFATVLAQAITPVVPTVTAEGYDQLYEVFQTGFGDNCKFTVDSNELYIVNDIAEGIKRGAQNTLYNTEYTIQAQRRQISTFVDWYQVASGVQDWGKFGVKIGASFAAAIQALVVNEMTKVITDAADHGIGGYTGNGFSDNNWLTLARNVSLANGGAPVYALGTEIALGKILPATTNSQFWYDSDSDIVTKGRLAEYKNVPLIPIGNALKPNTINNTPSAVVGDNFVYMIAMGSYKPCKVVFEGDQIAVQEDPLGTKDHSYNLTVDMRIGVGCVVGSKFGYMTLG